MIHESGVSSVPLCLCGYHPRQDRFQMNVLLVNPPIYDFTAFDFWLRPYGLLRVAGQLRSFGLTAFDYLVSRDPDEFGRGRFDRQPISRPAALADIPRRF